MQTRRRLSITAIAVVVVAGLGLGVARTSGTASVRQGSATACTVGSEEANVDLALAYLDAFATADEAAFDAILGSGYAHRWGIGDDSQDAEELKVRVAEWASAFQGGPFEIEQVVEADDTVVVRWTRTGTQVGWYGAAAPSDVEVSYTGINIFRVECGRIVESWNESDHLGRLQRSGHVTDGELGTTATPTP